MHMTFGRWFETSYNKIVSIVCAKKFTTMIFTGEEFQNFVLDASDGHLLSPLLLQHPSGYRHDLEARFFDVTDELDLDVVLANG